MNGRQRAIVKLALNLLAEYARAGEANSVNGKPISAREIEAIKKLIGVADTPPEKKHE